MCPLVFQRHTQIYNILTVYVGRRLPAQLAALVIRDDISRHTKRGKSLRKIARLARAYEVGIKNAELTSGRRRTRLEILDLSTELYVLADRMIEIQPRTMTGVMIFARAAALRSAIDRSTGSDIAFGIADHTVAALMRITEGAAA